ncbi:metallophosphoesterase family protein [Companilactobacillus hulinensis]|uniref:metallophosphoesterase family protein n=1 Tax=Companilactobacillus hulinensis TaxID=2486007 RepID=UPI000F77C4DC|nr:DNA repair exonuclease [Companilactobacillus hulinensis]
MKFIHAADLHLDTPFISISNFSQELQQKLKSSTYTAADKIFQTAISEQVDFVILAGDTFDNTERTLGAQMYLKNKFDELNKYGIKVFMVYGNHDYYRDGFSVIDFPNNVTIFSDEVSTSELVTNDGQNVGITGFSYYQNHVTEDMVQNYPDRKSYDYQIGILHAGIGDGNYAPFSVSELLTKGYDYWALGHIHKREVLHENPWIIYPGDTQGRNQNELEQKGFYLVTVENGITKPKFISSSIYVWKNAEIDVVENDTINDLNEKIKNLLNESNSLVTLNIVNAQRLNKDIIKAIERNEILMHFAGSNTAGVLYKIYLKFNNNRSLSMIDEKYWKDSEPNVFDLDNIKDMDSKLFSEEIIREHINDPGFLNHIKELTKNSINKKYIGD